ncbi:MAG: sigma-70 family RNA polymerase sigma factor [Thermoleophilia bacterium]|nr:sigma-70 family RNA polymerase sigma factor [Thermoleophilia bacterium]MDH4340198.1 sigma-70 family RNA polymerase sigma factor [Thermoleophilia bacterium]MDH5281225.1 sigma-70 family RNA polymerase sigma factor [Thermoleophilia bacterium]
MRRLPDNELIALARKGSTEAAGVLFDRYWTLAWRAGFAVSQDRSVADEAAQEAMEKAFVALDRFDETRPFGPWLKRIAINRAIDHLRRNRRTDAHYEAETTFHAWAVGESAADDIRRWAVADAVAALGAGKRVVVVLHYWLDLPLEEIAGVLGLPVGTVASRLARAKRELEAALEEERVI